MKFNFFKRAEVVEEHTLDESTGEVLSNYRIDPQYVGKNEAMDIAAFDACVNLISGDVAKLPIRLYRRSEERIKEVTDDRRTYLLNTDPGDTLTAYELKKAMVVDYYTGKGGYCFIEKSGTRYESLRYVKQEDISFQFNTDPIFKSYSIMVNGKRYMPHEFIRILRNTKNGWDSLSIQAEAQKTLSVAYSLLTYEENQNTTGGNKKGFLKSEHKLAKDAINFVRTQWKKLYSNGGENVMVLNDGMDFKEVSATSMEMQLNQNKNTNAKDIMKLFLVPPGMLDGTKSAEDKKQYIDECLGAPIAAIENALNRDFLTEAEKEELFFSVDTYELTKGDTESRYNAYEKGLKNGFIQVDEVRRKENLEPLGLNYIKLGLQDVLFDPVTKDLIVPNMGSAMNLKDAVKANLKEGGKENAD